MGKHLNLAVLDMDAFNEKVVRVMRSGETHPLAEEAILRLSARGSGNRARRFQGLATVARRVCDPEMRHCHTFENARTFDPSIKEVWHSDDFADLALELVVRHALKHVVWLPRSAASLLWIFRADVFGLAPERIADPKARQRVRLHSSTCPPRPEELGVSADLAPALLTLEQAVWGVNSCLQGWLDAGETELLHLALSDLSAESDPPAPTSHPVLERLSDATRDDFNDPDTSDRNYREAWKNIRTVCDIVELAVLSGGGVLAAYDLDVPPPGTECDPMPMSPDELRVRLAERRLATA